VQRSPGFSLSLNQPHGTFGDQSLTMWKDLFFSLLLHVLAFTMMITFALWKEQKHDEPLARIEVTMVSNKELANLQQQANPVARPKSRSIQTRARLIEPESISSPQAAPKSVIKPVSAARPVMKPKTAPRPAIKPQATPELVAVLKQEALSEPSVQPEAAPESVINPEQASESIVKLEPAMRPVVRFEPLAKPVVRQENLSKPVLTLKAEPEAAVDMAVMPESMIDMEPRPVPVINMESGSAPLAKPVVRFKPATHPGGRQDTAAKPVLTLKAEPEATVDMAVMTEPRIDMEPRPVPMSRPKSAALPKPALKPEAAPMAKLKLLPMAKPETDPNYDPFAPLESASDQKHRHKTVTTKALDLFQSELARITEKHLSQQEINSYIGRMQAAVERHWKIPVAIDNVKDPLVEMVLQPGGHIQSLIILESSGNAALNASLIRAIQAAAPFELPKEQFEYFRVNRIRFHPF